MRRIFRPMLGVALLAFGASEIAYARADGSSPQVRGQKIRDFVRLTFEWPEPTLFTAKTDGNNVILTFDRKANPNMGAVLKQLHPYITKAERKGDGKTIVLTLNAPHRIRTFISDNISGIDLLDVKNTKLAKVEPKPKAIAQNEAVTAAELAPAAGEEETAKVVELKAEKKAEVPAAVVSEAKPAEPTPAARMEKKPEEPIEAPAHTPSSNMMPLAVDNVEDAPVAEAAPEEKAVPQEAVESAPVAPVEMSQESSAPEAMTTNKIVVSADTEAATLRFPLKERTAMAAFIRINTLWVVLDKKLDFDLSDFEGLPVSVIGKAVLVPHATATILRIPVQDNIYPEIKQQEGQLDVAILLSGNKKTPDAAMEIAVSTEPPVLPHVFVPALEVGKTVEIEDSDVGDVLSITPVFAREQGIASTRGFVEFTLLPSAQGITIAKKADATMVTAVREGLRISLPKGAHLSAAVAGGGKIEEKALPVTSSGTLFPGESWMLEAGKDPKLAIKKLFNQTVFAENDGAKNLARLRLAQLYLHDGFVVEAMGLLDNINRTSPSYYRSAKLASMRGAANFLLYRFNDAARDFGSADLNNNPEALYWRDMLADLLGNPDKTYDFLAMNENYISKYPPIFRQRLAIVAADRAIGSKEYNAALKIFDSLAKDNIIAPIQPYVDFLTAKISSENGQEEEALKTWKRLAAESPNKFVQARAIFSTILSELDNNVITRDQAMDQLERLRLRWHGDGLELQVVQLLGDLYLEKKDYVNAMRVWQIGVSGFKNTGPAVEMARKMEDIFARLFSEGIADKMTPLEALALYYEYRNYTPTGEAGAQMIEKLADRLVGVDLLSTAAQLLEQQMRTQAEKSERSRLGAKLADIYLLNNQPKKAMKSLQESVYGDNPILLRIKRNQLVAESIMQLGRPDEALAVLGKDEGVEAEKLRAMIYWGEKNWTGMAESIENILKKRVDPSVALSVEEGEYVLRLALAYVFAKDTAQLQYMRDYFGPLMASNPYKAAFDFVTAPDIALSTRNFDDILKMLAKTRGFIDNYEARIDLAEAN